MIPRDLSESEQVEKQKLCLRMPRSNKAVTGGCPHSWYSEKVIIKKSWKKKKKAETGILYSCNFPEH